MACTICRRDYNSYVHPKNGLSQTEAVNRQIKFGPNGLLETGQRTSLERVIGQFNNVLIYVLSDAGGCIHWRYLIRCCGN